MRIANNVPALLTHINVRQNDRRIASSMNRLSTGLRINSAREDAAGMAIANKLSFQLVGLERASDNSQHGISVVQTAEGALNEVHAMLHRIRELAVQAANDTNVTEDRMKIQREINDLVDELTALSGRSEFNTIKLLNGEAARVATNWLEGLDGTLFPDAILTRILANTLFVSENVPAGTLRYDIVAPAMPAQIVGDVIVPRDWTRPVSDFLGRPDAPFTGGVMRLNGVEINVMANHTMNDIWQMMVNSSEYSGVIPAWAGAPPDHITFTSVRNGSHESVELSGNADLWDLFGVYLPPTIPGQDEGEGYAWVFSDSVINGTMPALIEVPAGSGNWVDPGPALDLEGIFNINGWPVRVTPNMTERNIIEAIIYAGNRQHIHGNISVASWDVAVGPNAPFPDDDLLVNEWRIVPQPRDATHDIEIESDNVEILDAILDAVGIAGIVRSDFLPAADPRYRVPAPSANRTSISAEGLCIQLENVRMYDRNDVLMTAFNNSISWTTIGNRVTVKSANGHQIELNINVREAYRSNATLGVIVSVQATDPITGLPLFEDVPDIDPLTGRPLSTTSPVAVMEYRFVEDINMKLRIEPFGGLRVQIGPNYNMNMDIQIPRINSETLGLVDYRDGRMIRLVHLTTQEGAQRAINQADDAIRRISRVRARLGAYQNRLEHTIRNLDNSALNTEAARSRVQDVDMAREMTELSKRNVMYQAGLAILGQANQRPQMILQLLQ